MALRKTLAHRLFNMAKISSQILSLGFLHWWLQKRRIFHSAAPPECLSLPIGDQLIEQLRGMNDDRLRLDRLRHPGLAAAAPTPSPRYDLGISVKDVRKLLRVSQLETVKSALRGVLASKSSVSYGSSWRSCRGVLDRIRTRWRAL
ncbi:hypothetical protein AAC387_Pa02g2298 [Persea americana]